MSKMRFEFELADPAHLESVLGALKRVDSVYDAYRALPGPATVAEGSAERLSAGIGPRRYASGGGNG